jgi:alpha-beta hydrolase superfamily lysophospholipase/SAM-dependent methyltransferase
MNAKELTFTSWDGAELFYRAWIPKTPTDKALLLFHRGHEHSGRWQETVDALGFDDVAIFAWDARGHGKSPGERGAARNLLDVIKDVDAFARHISNTHCVPIENMIVLAHSLAAVTVTAWVHDYAPPIRAMILATAAFHVKLYVPFAIPFLRTFRPRFAKSYVKSKMLTHDREQAARYDADPLIFRQIAVNVLLDLHDTAKRLVADAGAIQTPTLMIGAGKDWVVSLEAQRKFFDGLSSSDKSFEVFPDSYHAIFQETNRAQVVDLVQRFVAEQFAKKSEPASLQTADRSGFTFSEYERLKNNGNAKFAIARTGLKFAGKLSRGIEIGQRSGFDSGLSLDYVYENKPNGLVDKLYLNSPGWRGIRQRRLNLEKALRDLISKLQNENRPVRILDIAAGAGRYVIETIRAFPQIPIRATLCDYKQENVDAMRSLADEMNLNGAIIARRGDAFDRNSLAAIRPRATIGIVSGLYELFPANDAVSNSLRGLADAIEPGGYLIYTNQPWHPQLEFIAHVLRNREGERWIMRRRTTSEMDELVRAAGFEKIDMEIDEWGMFTVSVAQRSHSVIPSRADEAGPRNPSESTQAFPISVSERTHTSLCGSS